MTTHEEISKRAREIWEREGRPEGRDIEHWLQAEAELRPEQQLDSTVNRNGNTADTTLSSSSLSTLKDDNARKRTARRGSAVRPASV